MSIEKHSIIIAGHQTSVSLEPEFWKAFKDIAKQQNVSPTELITEIDVNRAGGLSSAIRVYVLEYLQNKE